MTRASDSIVETLNWQAVHRSLTENLHFLSTATATEKVALDYGLAMCKMIGQSYMLHCRVIESQYKLNLAVCLIQ